MVTTPRAVPLVALELVVRGERVELRVKDGASARLAYRATVVPLPDATPTAPETGPVRVYLREFLSDPRVLDMNPVGRALLLNLIILQTRPQKKGKDYETIWNRDRNEGPLKTITRAQAENLASRLAPAAAQA